MGNDDFTEIGGDFSAYYEKETMIALYTTKDLLGVMLRVHVCLEGLLNLWCSKITKCDDFFNVKSNISFITKLEISEKLGLPSDLAKVFRQFNSRRNDFAHQMNYIISDNQLNDIRHAIDRIPVHISPTILKVADSFIVQSGSTKVGWDSPDISSLQKLLMLFSSFHIKIVRTFVTEFIKEGVSFSLKNGSN